MNCMTEDSVSSDHMEKLNVQPEHVGYVFNIQKNELEFL